MTTFITATELNVARHNRPAPVVLDVRWKLGGPPGLGDYLAGHIPGAVYVDLDAELASHGEPSDGRHPLPDIGALQENARRWGINDGDTVVVYDGEGNLAAGRAWWLLRWAGITDVRILNGALPAWVRAGFALATDEVKPTEGTITLRPGQLPTLDIEDVATFDGIVLDARAPERYRGEVEPIDPKAGHIPGAINLPTGGNLDPEGRFLPVDQLIDRFAAVGVTPGTPVAVYCGSGVTAAHQVAALDAAGIPAILFPGSWSQWSNTDRPVATGSDA